MAIAAVILAGGQGTRLGGVNKALLDVGGRRMIDRVRDAVSRSDPIVLSVGMVPFEIEGIISVPDLPSAYGGPLAGIAAAVDHLLDDPPKLLLSVAVDTPFFPLDFVSRAGPLIASAPAVVSGWRGQTYPTNTLWKFPSLRDLPDRVRAGSAPHSLKRLAEELGAAVLDYGDTSLDNPFANANTWEQLAALDSRARAGGECESNPNPGPAETG